MDRAKPGLLGVSMPARMFYRFRRHYVKVIVAVLVIVLLLHFETRVSFEGEINSKLNEQENSGIIKEDMKVFLPVQVIGVNDLHPKETGKESPDVKKVVLEQEPMQKVPVADIPEPPVVVKPPEVTITTTPPTQIKKDVVTVPPVTKKPEVKVAPAKPASTPKDTLPFCPRFPPFLDGPLKVRLDAPSMEDLEKQFPEVSPGGLYKPKNCKSRHRVGIVVPYSAQDETNLRTFLLNLHPLLKKQQLDYGIYVIEQEEGKPRNKAMLMNVGYMEAWKRGSYQCFIFHDVDLIPEDDRNLYSCPFMPRHMLPYEDTWGGVGAIRKDHMTMINGFSNRFWGRSGEDADLAGRVRGCGMRITRYPMAVAKYTKLGNTPTSPAYRTIPPGFVMQETMKMDGLSQLNYTVKQFQLKPLYTWIKVDLHPVGLSL